MAENLENSAMTNPDIEAQAAAAKLLREQQGTENRALKSVTITEGDTLSAISSRALGPHASRRDIYNYVNQIARHNHIENPDKIYADDSLQLPEFYDPRTRQARELVRPAEKNQVETTDKQEKSETKTALNEQARPEFVPKIVPEFFPTINPGARPDTKSISPEAHRPETATNTPEAAPRDFPLRDGGSYPDIEENSKDGSEATEQAFGPATTLDKTIHVTALALAGAGEHIEAHPVMVASETIGGAVIGGAMAAKSPTWLTAAVAIGGISYMGKLAWDKSKELLPALDTIYQDNADSRKLAEAEQIVKHDLGVGLVDTSSILLGGIGAKVITNKLMAKGSAAVVTEEAVEQGLAKGATAEAPKGEQTAGQKSGTDASDKSAGTTGTNSANNTATDKAPANPSNNSGDKTLDKKHEAGDHITARGETLESGSADWTGNKYPAKGDTSATIRYRQEDSKWVSDDARVAMVADGMGGHGGGDTASLITSEIFQTRMPLLKANSSEEEARTWLKETIETAAQRIKQAQSEGSYTDLDGTIHTTTSNMGSTVVATVKHNNKMLIAWAGDSRAYQLRGGKLKQLTEDHSWDNEARKLGLSEKEIAEADQGHIISSALGSRLTIGQTTVDIQPGDRFLLASDGLETLQPNAIEALLGSSGNADETAQNLIAAVKNAFARNSINRPFQDNTTVIVLDAPQPPIYGKAPMAANRPAIDFRPVATALRPALPMAATGGVSAFNQYFLEIPELNGQAENIQ